MRFAAEYRCVRLFIFASLRSTWAGAGAAYIIYGRYSPLLLVQQWLISKSQ